jgi:O-antigen/teichoic acid export membrane protein
VTTAATTRGKTAAALDRRLARNARIYALASGLGALLHASHLAWAWVLTPEEYGRFANLEGLFKLANSPLTLAPQGFVLAHLHKLGRERFAASLGTLLTVAAVLLLATLVAVPFVPEGVLARYGAPRWAVTTVLVAAFLVGPTRMAAGIAEGRGRARETSIWLELVNGLRPLIAVACFLGLGLRWEARVVGLVLAQGGAGVVAYVLLQRGGRLAPPNPRLAPPAAVLGFAIPAMLATVASTCYDVADRFVVTHFWGLDAAGRYDLAYRVAMLTQTVNVVFRRSFTPLFYQAHAAGDAAGMRRALSQAGRRLLRWTVPLATGVPVLLFALPVFRSGYREALPVVPVVAVGVAFWGLQMLWQQVLLAEGRAATVLGVTGLGAVVNVGLNLVLVPVWAEMGAALATLACFLVMFLVVRWLGEGALRRLGPRGADDPPRAAVGAGKDAGGT